MSKNKIIYDKEIATRGVINDIMNRVKSGFYEGEIGLFKNEFFDKQDLLNKVYSTLVDSIKSKEEKEVDEKSAQLAAEKEKQNEDAEPSRLEEDIFLKNALILMYAKVDSFKIDALKEMSELKEYPFVKTWKGVFYKSIKPSDIFDSNCEETEGKVFVKEQLKFHRIFADLRYVESQYLFGMLLENGIGIKKDEKQAFKYYKLAADQGDDSAQYSLGRFFENGIGIEKNEKQAFKYYKLAADQGYADAQYSLGRFFEQGVGTKKDEKQAFKYYKLAADQGYADAQYSLEKLFENGIGIEKDEKQAFKSASRPLDDTKADSINTSLVFSKK